MDERNPPDKGKAVDDNGDGAPRAEFNSPIFNNIRSSLQRKDDTSRFVGLTMLRSFLDSPSELRDPQILASLWEAISPRFLDRLIKSNGVGGQKDGNRYPTLDLGVSILHRFTLLLPEETRRQSRLVGRIPTLVDALLQSSPETTQLIVQTLLELVTFPEGSAKFHSVSDLSPLVEAAPTEPLVLEIFDRAWLNLMIIDGNKPILQETIDTVIRGLISSFKGTDGVTLLQFLGDFLRKSHIEALPLQPNWIKPTVDFVRNLLVNKPNQAARKAYTIVSASLLEVYPAYASRALFDSDGKGDTPFSYLFITLILADIRATTPRLLSLLNDPSYPDTAKRIGSAFDIVTHFISHLVKMMDSLVDEDDVDEMSVMPAEFLLKLRTGISETMSLAIEFLRERWDASVAGAMGLHPDARPGAAEQWRGHLPISWESTRDVIDIDPFVLATVRSMALWLREDENKLLRKEAAGLMDFFMDLYKASSLERLDFRSPVLVALEGIIVENKGIDAFIANGGWEVLTKDLATILQTLSAPTGVGSSDSEKEAARGLEIVRVLLPFVEAEQNGTEEDWMGLVTSVAAWSPPSSMNLGPAAQDCLAAVFQLVIILLSNAHEGMRKRFVYSTSAIVGIANQLRDLLEEEEDAKERNGERQGADEESENGGGDGALKESIDDVIATLESMR